MGKTFSSCFGKQENVEYVYIQMIYVNLLLNNINFVLDHNSSGTDREVCVCIIIFGLYKDEF